MANSFLVPVRQVVNRPGHAPYMTTRYKKVSTPQQLHRDEKIRVIRAIYYHGDLEVVLQAWKEYIGTQSEDLKQSLMLPISALQEYLYGDQQALLAIHGNRIMGIATYKIVKGSMQVSHITPAPKEIINNKIHVVQSILFHFLGDKARDEDLKVEGIVGKPQSITIEKLLDWISKQNTYQGQTDLYDLDDPLGKDHIWENEDHEDRLQKVITDDDGTQTFIYSKDNSEGSEAENFARLKEFSEQYEDIQDRVELELSNQEEAMVVYIIMNTGLRVGNMSEPLTPQQTYGISNLEPDHIEVEGDKITFTFNSQDSIIVNRTLTDKKVAKILNTKKEEHPDRPLFDTTDYSVNEYVKKLTDNEFSIKDFRVYYATKLALKEVDTYPLPVDSYELEEFKEEIGTIVSTSIGSNIQDTIKHYILPEAFVEWEANVLMTDAQEGIYESRSKVAWVT